MAKKIPIVDDSPFQRKMLMRALASLGFEFRQAGDGREALTALKTFSPDLVFADLVMPNMDGMALLRDLASHDFKVPIVVLTADIQEPVKAECMKLGVKAFLNKPFNEELLLATVKQILGL
ncbi:response regulator [Bdellovibrionota bacterium FG-2]